MKEKSYRVGTFMHDGKVACYLRDYHPSWESCREFVVIATSGAEAKKKARALRLESERANT
jgi:hypothetical protein